MPRKQTPQPASPVLGKPQLEAAIRTIDKRIADLKAFDVSPIQERWDPRVEALETKVTASLAEILGEGTPEFNRHYVGQLDDLSISMGERHHPDEIRQSLKEGIEGAVVKLNSLRDLFSERLEGLPDHVENSETRASREVGDRVFIVHGRDEAAKEAAARFIAQLGLKPIILHEQPNAGRTIIEKLEGHLDVGFAVILLTPDDVGGLAGGQPQLRNRARQNVVLELGLFIGALGRARVCALHKGNLELPSDFDGVVYVPMDDAGGWRLLLAREMKQAGFQIDLNRAM
jgi:predicted nucleotide-binding protein